MIPQYLTHISRLSNARAVGKRKMSQSGDKRKRGDTHEEFLARLETLNARNQQISNELTAANTEIVEQIKNHHSVRSLIRAGASIYFLS